MSTRSRIAVATPDGFRSVYCHHDGYLSHNGRILFNHYRGEDNYEKVHRLIAEGDMSSLGEEIGEKHDFDNIEARQGQCTFYRRDRSEQDVQAAVHKSFADLVQYARDSDAEFLYVNLDGLWLFAPMDRLSKESDIDALMPLTPDAWFGELVRRTAYAINRKYGKGYLEGVELNGDGTTGCVVRGFAENVTDRKPFRVGCKNGRKYLTFLGRTRRIVE
jgi:hypothetical protein